MAKKYIPEIDAKKKKLLGSPEKESTSRQQQPVSDGTAIAKKKKPMTVYRVGRGGRATTTDPKMEIRRTRPIYLKTGQTGSMKMAAIKQREEKERRATIPEKTPVRRRDENVKPGTMKVEAFEPRKNDESSPWKKKKETAYEKAFGRRSK